MTALVRLLARQAAAEARIGSSLGGHDGREADVADRPEQERRPNSDDPCT